MISKCLCFLNRGDNGPRSQMEELQQCSVWDNTSTVNRLRFGYSPTSTRLRKSLLVTALVHTHCPVFVTVVKRDTGSYHICNRVICVVLLVLLKFKCNYNIIDPVNNGLCLTQLGRRPNWATYILYIYI